jgi:hypothetical protein
MKFNCRINTPFDPSKVMHRENAAVAFAVGFVELDKNDQNITRNHIQPSKTT